MDNLNMNAGALPGEFGRRPNEYAPETIIARSTPEPNTGCWLWTEGLNQWGYGKLMIRHKGWIAHRASFKIFKEEIPEGLLVLHKCDTRSCVNPEHLYLGDNDQNMADMVVRGRSCSGDKNTSRKNPHLQIRGASHPASKLTEEDVVKIKTRLARGEKQKSIAKDFGVGSNNISEINVGRTWKHITVSDGMGDKIAW